MAIEQQNKLQSTEYQMSEVKKLILEPQEVVEIFVNTTLEDNYDFLQDDLVKLANAFAQAAKPKIAKDERALCIEVARSVNHLVADKIMEVRGQL